MASVCVFWTDANASTTSSGLSSWLRPLKQAFSVRRSSWQPIYTEAKHSSIHRQSNRGSLWCQSECVCVLISYWDSRSARDWLQMLIFTLSYFQRTSICPFALVETWINLSDWVSMWQSYLSPHQIVDWCSRGSSFICHYTTKLHYSRCHHWLVFSGEPEHLLLITTLLKQHRSHQNGRQSP